MKKHLKNRQGFTLIELVVVLAITSIVLVAIGGIMVFGNNIVKNTNYKFDEHTMALLLEQKIKNTVQNSTSLTIYNDPSFLSSCTNGYLYFDTTPSGGTANAALIINPKSGAPEIAFQKGYFKGYTVTVSFKETSAAVLHVTISIYNNANANDNYTLNTDIPINNIGRGFTSASITDNTGGNPNGGALIGFTPYTSP
ncbi:PulJ/GspJ family protein [Ethanoligenens harbinense]|uniref:Prepilin-type N-terminal cleavage/methylation domain-containing protein n=1 Tax=Ethanoligenens harbinense (strain DSM 18485 / JCM 12961 / CGMCC 1.5033 / YUAN-3) TaxID=663278 RepID=E6U2Z8_ETHHY|nr:prepilin-type N-terminal cleavage/methylation domain-containing protein [Ethanoligenens harbinense]ADU26365.1 hypothetical protein Ethha_0796 [Ethanoligenens harbinense YUAN-3]AVQ95494.1 prepilin-type cleavage/methylation domain-containing protein [Ethanoligenens harbinense YUAN-3]AYF38158.1 prepilin-type cleavage/methylation domain-containing protein [Ethanoligenens harbinense]AYF40903.1 prepilin-type cleavage/methylation domain-containing protein [Ethanoligenens harbinense]QCN91735.1 prep